MAERTSPTLLTSKLDWENCVSSWFRRVDISESCTRPLPLSAVLAGVPEARDVAPALGWARSARVGSDVVLVIFIATPASETLSQTSDRRPRHELETADGYRNTVFRARFRHAGQNPAPLRTALPPSGRLVRCRSGSCQIRCVRVRADPRVRTPGRSRRSRSRTLDPVRPPRPGRPGPPP